MTTVTPLRPHPTLSALRGALAVMEAAELVGLPIPTHLSTSSHGAVTYGYATRVTFIPESLADLHRWADWLGVEVREVLHSDTVQHVVEAVVFDQHVEACVIEAAQ